MTLEPVSNLCGTREISESIKFGKHPVSKRYLAASMERA
jgi:hypothetical protein